MGQSGSGPRSRSPSLPCRTGPWGDGAMRPMPTPHPATRDCQFITNAGQCPVCQGQIRVCVWLSQILNNVPSRTVQYSPVQSSTVQYCTVLRSSSKRTSHLPRGGSRFSRAAPKLPASHASHVCCSFPFYCTIESASSGSLPPSLAPHSPSTGWPATSVRVHLSIIIRQGCTLSWKSIGAPRRTPDFCLFLNKRAPPDFLPTTMSAFAAPAPCNDMSSQFSLSRTT